jgi:hypothetical protein
VTEGRGRAVLGPDRALEARRAVAGRRVDRARVERAEDRREGPDQRHQEEEAGADRDDRVAQEARGEGAAGRQGRGRGGRQQGRLGTQWRILGSNRL